MVCGVPRGVLVGQTTRKGVHMNRGLIGTIIGILVIIVLVIVIMQLI